MPSSQVPTKCSHGCQGNTGKNKWPRIRNDVQKFCHTCHVCQVVGNHGRSLPVAPLHPLSVKPFAHIMIDNVGPLPKCKLISVYHTGCGYKKSGGYSATSRLKNLLSAVSFIVPKQHSTETVPITEKREINSLTKEKMLLQEIILLSYVVFLQYIN